MQVAVIGSSGVAGSYAVQALRRDGHIVREVSRRTGIDVYTGDGLKQALADVDVVIDSVNTTSLRRAVAVDIYSTTARRLHDAAQAQGVAHLVLLSILGIDRVRGYGYYEAKLAQEAAATAGPVPVTVLRSAQFHEFPGQLLDRLRLGPFAVVPHIRSQPVAARTVGAHLARLAGQRPGGLVELAGPDVHDIVDLARRLARARQQRLRVIAISPPGRAARDMRTGALLATDTTTVDGPTYDDWLRSGDSHQTPVALSAVAESSKKDSRSQP
jgi:uncharacterized protein YbjT (DUF2867 family)